MLFLHPGQVSTPHRSHAAVAGQAFHFMFVQLLLEVDAIQRLQAAIGGGDVEDVAQEFLHAARGAQAVQCAHHEGGIAQPAVAIVPVARRVGRFRDGGGHGRDDRAAVFVLAQLQGDGAADHRFLPVQWNGQVAHPFAPVVGGAFLCFTHEAGDIARQPFVRTQHQVQGA